MRVHSLCLALAALCLLSLAASVPVDHLPANFLETDEQGLSIPYWGKWCGPGYPGPNGGNPPPMDKMDTACRDHDHCYSQYGYFDCGCNAQLMKMVTPKPSDCTNANCTVHWVGLTQVFDHLPCVCRGGTGLYPLGVKVSCKGCTVENYQHCVGQDGKPLIHTAGQVRFGSKTVGKPAHADPKPAKGKTGSVHTSSSGKSLTDTHKKTIEAQLKAHYAKETPKMAAALCNGEKMVFKPKTRAETVITTFAPLSPVSDARHKFILEKANEIMKNSIPPARAKCKPKLESGSSSSSSSHSSGHSAKKGAAPPKPSKPAGGKSKHK